MSFDRRFSWNRTGPRSGLWEKLASELSSKCSGVKVGDKKEYVEMLTESWC